MFGEHLCEAEAPTEATAEKKLAPLQEVCEEDSVLLRSSKASEAMLYGLFAVVCLGLTDGITAVFMLNQKGGE